MKKFQMINNLNKSSSTKLLFQLKKSTQSLQEMSMLPHVWKEDKENTGSRRRRMNKEEGMGAEVGRERKMYGEQKYPLKIQ